MAQEKDPGRMIALLALSDVNYQPAALLERVIRAAFDQLCWLRTSTELEALLSELTRALNEDAS